jgi:probable phosphoglycerate mutase
MLSSPVPSELLVLRHAEVHNPKDIVYGRLPRFGLSRQGRAQALRAARFLSGRTLAAIYTSPLLRARQTARIVAQEHPDVPLHLARPLIEVRTGYQGSPNSILKAGFSFYEPLKAPDDETMEDVRARLLAFARTLLRRHAGKSVLLVSHADPIAILRLALEGTPLTVQNLHRTVYPARASVLQVQVGPAESPRLTYFDIPGDGPT